MCGFLSNNAFWGIPESQWAALWKLNGPNDNNATAITQYETENAHRERSSSLFSQEPQLIC